MKNKKIEIFLNYDTFKRCSTGGMVHGKRVKIMVRFHNYDTVLQRYVLVLRQNLYFSLRYEKNINVVVFEIDLTYLYFEKSSFHTLLHIPLSIERIVRFS